MIRESLRQWIVSEAATGSVQTRDLAREFAMPISNAATAIRKCIKLGYIKLDGELGAHNRGTYVATDDGRRYLSDANGTSVRRYDDSALRSAFGMP